MAPCVFIIGASGYFGRPLITEFQKQKSRFARVAILSDPAGAQIRRSAEERNRGRPRLVPGFQQTYKLMYVPGFDVVLSLAGNATMRLQPAMIEAAIAGGASHFYPSEFGTDIAQDGVWQFRYFRDKVVTCDHLAAAAAAHPGFRYTLVLVGTFSEVAYSQFSGVDTEKQLDTNV
ncbi:hypothetical protein DFH09DRAFT_1095999 [Mycena vulgaris]|nr:hypothetical protein DFH09DRAFT_1095999 [Mycena vulgaris]